MPKRPSDQKSRRVRQSAAVTAVALLAAGLTVTTTPVAAQAAVPAVAQQWSTLMRRSLTANTDAVRLRAALAAQKATFATRVTELTRAQTANTTAQTRLTAATAADTTARAHLKTATTALSTAKQTLTKASKLRPRSAATVTRATNAVTAATKTVATRKAQAQQTTAALGTAQTGARTATAGLTTAITAWQTASVAIRNTQRKLTTIGTAAEHAGRAATLSRDVVTQVRPAFTTTDASTVYGMTVHKIVAFPLQRMIDDAKADGIAISGGGFRTKQRQIELRTINGCPDVWTAPSSSCRVPTAIPGRSLHEIGLAVDITSGGRTINAKSPAFGWLVKNAGRYGFVNLPSEAWHWSITGG
jgi:D-alanyl-D-alanine carboxypeptidase